MGNSQSNKDRLFYIYRLKQKKEGSGYKLFKFTKSETNNFLMKIIYEDDLCKISSYSCFLTEEILTTDEIRPIYQINYFEKNSNKISKIIYGITHDDFAYIYQYQSNSISFRIKASNIYETIDEVEEFSKRYLLSEKNKVI